MLNEEGIIYQEGRNDVLKCYSEIIIATNKKETKRKNNHLSDRI